VLACLSAFAEGSDMAQLYWQRKSRVTGWSRLTPHARGHDKPPDVGLDGTVAGIPEFAKSAPAAKLFVHSGLTARHLMQTVLCNMASHDGNDGVFQRPLASKLQPANDLRP
jgi:hypothetical protein